MTRGMDLGSLAPKEGSRHRGRYLGRGRASGHGKTSGRGIKGQLSRTGARRRPGFKGGDLREIMRFPKRGFVSPFKIDYRVVNVAELEARFQANDEVSPKSLVAKNVLPSAKPAVKVLGEGNLSKPLRVSAHAFSESAKQKIISAGGSVTLI